MKHQEVLLEKYKAQRFPVTPDETKMLIKGAYSLLNRKS